MSKVLPNHVSTQSTDNVILLCVNRYSIVGVHSGWISCVGSVSSQVAFHMGTTLQCELLYALCVSVHVFTYIRTYIVYCLCLYVHMYVHMLMHVFICTYVCAYTYM